MTDESANDGLRNSRRTHGSITRKSSGDWKRRASAGLDSGTRRVRLPRHDRAMMTSVAPAARRQFRIRIGRKQRRANQRETDKGHQQDCEDTPHCGLFYTHRTLVDRDHWPSSPQHSNLPHCEDHQSLGAQESLPHRPTMATCGLAAPGHRYASSAARPKGSVV